MKRLAFASLFALSFLFGSLAHAEEVVIKLGTVAPRGSTWHTILQEMGQKWSEASGGLVKLKVYPGGTLGNEGDMVKKMRIGQLQSAALTTIGLHEISPDPQAIDVPLMVDSFATYDYIIGKLRPRLEKALYDKGYVVLNWAEVGFVRLFSTKRYSTMAEFQSAKVFTWEGDPGSADAWRAAGFHPVVLSSTDIVPSLNTGLIDTVAMAPLYAFQSRIFEKAKYMLDLPWSILTGATVVKKDAWDKIAPDVQKKLLAIADDYGKRVATEVRRMDSEALSTMKQQGLTLVPPGDPAQFARAAEASHKVIRGRVVPEGIFDEVARLSKEAHKK